MHAIMHAVLWHTAAAHAPRTYTLEKTTANKIVCNNVTV